MTVKVVESPCSTDDCTGAEIVPPLPLTVVVTVYDTGPVPNVAVTWQSRFTPIGSVYVFVPESKLPAAAPPLPQVSVTEAWLPESGVTVNTTGLVEDTVCTVAGLIAPPLPALGVTA